MKQVVQLLAELSRWRIADHRCGGGEQGAGGREPHGAERPQPVLVEVDEFLKGVIAAPMGVAGAVREFLELAKRGRPPQYNRWDLVNACCYVVRNGCSWRMLPREFPPWENVYRTFRRWAAAGKFEQMHDRLRELWRSREERAPEPTAAVLDAQSTRSSPQGGPSGYDAGKKVKGRKRTLVVDTLWGFS